MTTVLIVTSDKNRFQHLAAGLEGVLKTAGIQWADTGQAALRLIENNPPTVAVVDEALPDMGGLDFVRRLVGINPWIHTAVISRLSPERFHEISEGLGVTAQLPGNPDFSDAEQLIKLTGLVPALSDGT